VANLRKLLFSKAIHQILIDFVQANTSSKQLALRASIILETQGNLNNLQIAKKLNIGRKCVGKWRERWHCSSEALIAIEANESRAALQRAVEDT
jgi:hypothetical protein